MTAAEGQPRLDDARHQNYYELLEVDPQAPRPEIIHAYDRATAAFAPGSLITYTLCTPEEAQLISGRVETVFRVLVDARQRGLYDQRLKALAHGEEVPPLAFAQQTRDTSVMTTREAEGAPRANGGERPPEVPSAPAHETPVISSDQRVNDIVASACQCDGSVIERVREARGVTLQQINASTKISPMNLRLIEEDNFASLPAPVFLRGFLQQIARCLSVDAHWVVDGYMAHFENWKATTRGCDTSL